MRVVIGDACPRRAATTVIGAPVAISKLAAVCRRSCRRRPCRSGGSTRRAVGGKPGSRGGYAAGCAIRSGEDEVVRPRAALGERRQVGAAGSAAERQGRSPRAARGSSGWSNEPLSVDVHEGFGDGDAYMLRRSRWSLRGRSAAYAVMHAGSVLLRIRTMSRACARQSLRWRRLGGSVRVWRLPTRRRPSSLR